MTASHAIYAPSSAHRWTVCTASAEAIAVLPEQEEGEAAKEGTNAHEELERVLNGGAPNRDHDAAYIVALTVDYVKKLGPGKLWVEQRVELTKDVWGRCDVAHFDGETLTIVDMKNGFVGVDAKENEQLMIYAAASVYTHNLPIKQFRLCVVQPNDWRPVPKVKQWPEKVEDWPLCSADALYAFAQRVATIPKADKTFVAGEHCRYCPLFGKCEPTRDLLAHLSVALQHSPNEVTPDQRAAFKMLEKPIADWFKGADKTWTKDALSGTVPTGMKLVTSQTHRAWIDEEAARAAVIAKAGVDGLKVPTPAQAAELGVDVETLARKPDGGPVLAFESDKRAPWKVKSAAEMFAGVTASAAAGK